MADDLITEVGRAAERLRGTAQVGLAYAQDPYDRERYAEILAVAARLSNLLSAGTGMPEAETLARWREEVVPGDPVCPTPRVGVGAVIFDRQDRILLIRRADTGRWFVPVGWADIGYTPAEVAAKEALEETGLVVRPVKLIGVYDSIRHHSPRRLHFYRLLFYCRLVGGELKPDPREVLEIGFFAQSEVPANTHGDPVWVAHAFACHRGELAEAYFDPL